MKQSILFFLFILLSTIPSYSAQTRDTELAAFLNQGAIRTEQQYNNAKQLYKKLALFYHPDKNPQGETIFKQISTKRDELGLEKPFVPKPSSWEDFSELRTKAYEFSREQANSTPGASTSSSSRSESPQSRSSGSSPTEQDRRSYETYANVIRRTGGPLISFEQYIQHKTGSTRYSTQNQPSSTVHTEKPQPSQKDINEYRVFAETLRQYGKTPPSFEEYLQSEKRKQTPSVQATYRMPLNEEEFLRQQSINEETRRVREGLRRFAQRRQ